MNRWKDVTSYRRGERGKAEPRTYELRTPSLSVVVTRHVDMPGTWVLKCRDAGIDLEDLQTDDLDDAVYKAFVEVESRLATRLAEVREVNDARIK